MPDAVVRGGTLVTPHGLVAGDLAIEDERIAAIGPGLPGAPLEIDARGLHVFPGVVDVHVHFNEPGRTDWEGAATGSRALAAGGGTLFADMPLNSTPCTVTAREFDRKRAALEAASVADFALWGGLVPGAVGEMAAVAERGAIGFKAFLCDSGLPEFPRVDAATLADGMREAARLGLPVAVHAERQELTTPPERHGDGAWAFVASRPPAAELAAIRDALDAARETGARLHLVHVSSAAGVAAAAEARARGVDVSIETCPHYLSFTEDDLAARGAVLKCAPPLRPAADRAALWAALGDGRIDLVASDHSPCPPELKTRPFADAWGGVAGVQSTLAVLLDAGVHARALPLERVAQLTAEAPARRFRLADRGTLMVGGWADLALVDLGKAFTLQPAELLQRHALSPYIGVTFRGSIRRTLRRGETIFADGRAIARTGGRLVRPGPAEHAGASRGHGSNSVTALSDQP
jgi:allantoinase